MFPNVETKYEETVEEVDGKVVEVKRLKVKDLESDTWITVQKDEIETGKTAEQVKADIQARADEEKAKYGGKK